MWINRYDSVDTIVFGRRSYEDHANYHSESARKASDPKFLFEYSRFLERSQKIVLSYFLTKAEWQNSRIMKGDRDRIIARLEREHDKDIIVDDGPSVRPRGHATGLADDYQIAVLLVILGRGKHYGGSMLKQQTLKLLSQESQVWRTDPALRDGPIEKADCEPTSIALLAIDVPQVLVSKDENRRRGSRGIRCNSLQEGIPFDAQEALLGYWKL